MRKYVYATLCGTLLLSSKAAFAIETSLLDRLAQERIIGDGQARPQAYPVPAQPGSPRAASPAQAPSANAELVGQLRQANEQLKELEQKLAAMEQGNALLIEQLAQRQAQGNSSPESSAQAAEQAQNQARIRELGQQLEGAQAQRDALAAELASARTATAGNASQDSALSAALGTARTEIAGLKQQAADLQAANQQLRDQQLRNQQLRDQQAAQSTQQAKADKADSAGRIVINDAAPKDVRVSYAVGAWYAESAPQETQKFASIGKKLDLQAFSQGFTDKINNRLQLPQAKLSAELDGAQQQLETAMLSKNEKESKALLAAAAKEKGAVKMPDGVIYRILDKDKSPSVADKNEILFDIEEQLSTGEELVRETRSSHVKDLPPLFQSIVKQLGLGGSAKILTPVTQAHAASGIPPGTVSIITIKLAGIK
ncbi:hypothetical protein KDH83_24765 [Achromobacter sp. Marseille-Q0513]|uniref:FKBP-type peptidyl-prolyl cis-trans isomerase N-terminal domain-containing protein n=1 Tax=Achromobacter sp. Marseille-Q0513 TaxID=2829161 RepID=UPI001B99E1FF|nr:FKBP-type peptidyl-prolyl cis-trans isomerase N-terminal domain-containing protein [Achromobacter sp. Marseille-Q0513]MBR8656530.1 hypothetical protein [Achromobacter sp. Marseille-Q0513]